MRTIGMCTSLMINIMHNALADVSLKAASSNNCVSIIITVISTVIVFLLSSVIFFIAGAVCMRFFQSKTTEEDSESTMASALDMASAAVQNQPIPIYENVHTSMPMNDYDFQENVAYGHVM